MTRINDVSLSTTHPFRGLARNLRPARVRLGLAWIAFVVKDSPQWVLPVITAVILDTVVDGGPWTTIALLASAAGLLVLVNYPMNAIWVRLYSRTVRDLGVRLRNALAHRLQELSIGYHNRANSSIIQTKVVRDVENVELMMLQGSQPLLSAISTLSGGIVVLALQLPIALAVFVLVVPLSALLVRWLRSRTDERNEEFRRDVELFSARVGEMASLLPITRAHGLEPTATSRLTAGAQRVRESGLSLDIVNGRFNSIAWVSFQLLAIVCLAGAALVAVAGWLPISPGQVVLLSTYFVTITSSVVGLLNLAPLLTRGRESLRSIAEVLDEPDIEQNAGKDVPRAVNGTLRFEHVTLRYPEGDLAIDDVDLRIPAGTTVAFVGASGAGKSTLLNLALGFVRPTSGRILLDGVDTATLDLRAVRRHVSVVPQESVLFTGSIRDNVVYGLDDVPDAAVREVLAAANVLDTVEALPDGWNTVVGERGARLSGGQRQRLSIARALIRDPRILLLDEATSALDSESETLVRDALQRLMRGRTTLIVAHRFSTIRAADFIVVLENGRIVEQGIHDQLVAAGGVYARMHAAQAS